MSSKEKQQAEKINIEKTIVIDTSPEVVFKAITDPNELTNWFPDQAILEAKVGGKVKFSFTRIKNASTENLIFSQRGTLLNLSQTKK